MVSYFAMDFVVISRLLQLKAHTEIFLNRPDPRPACRKIQTLKIIKKGRSHKNVKKLKSNKLRKI